MPREFYHRFLKALVAIDLKLGSFEPEHAERVTFSPPGLSRGVSGFCATQNSRKTKVAQKPLNHRREVGGEILTTSRGRWIFT